MPPSPDLKQLGIKVGTVKRTKKEYEMYIKEEVAQRAKIEKMKTAGDDEADVKKQIEVLNDTLTVIPDTRQRLQKYCQELREFLEDRFKDIEGAAGSGELAAEDEARPLVLEGRQLLRDASDILGAGGDEVLAGVDGTGSTSQCDEF
mmetsp:Transcript_40622/g.81855  ORF Transcript_40622/g.81855 Transcript_40622/m.81855 type:complete len:147 (-) Transcript_40622:177-617(-)